MQWNTIVFANGRTLKFRVFDTKTNTFEPILRSEECKLRVIKDFTLENKKSTVTAEKFGILCRIIAELPPAEQFAVC